MKDYKRIASKISKMGKFSDIHQCGGPTKNFPVNLYFKLAEPYVIGYDFYVDYSFGEWSIDYSVKPMTTMRTDMKHIGGIKTEKDLLVKVETILNQTRKKCGVLSA